MKQRPDGDIEIDEKFWEEGFHIPVCKKCQGVLKPDVRWILWQGIETKQFGSVSYYTFGFFEGNLFWRQPPEAKSYSSNGSCETERCISCLGFIFNDNVCFSPCQVMGENNLFHFWVCICISLRSFQYTFCRAAHEAGAMTAIVNIGETRADDLVPLKINARVGEVRT